MQLNRPTIHNANCCSLYRPVSTVVKGPIYSIIRYWCCVVHRQRLSLIFPKGPKEWQRLHVRRNPAGIPGLASEVPIRNPGIGLGPGLHLSVRSVHEVG